ncbi:MAG: hypothetical protein RR636_01435 [Clostridium sp.]|uniref:hypothetical protein n=1 Tax=Clostridium sp. TaxID=1506 RepID=UPI00303B87D2
MDSILSVRINEGLKEKFLKLAEEQGVNNKEFMDVIIKAYELNKASCDVDYIKNDVEELQIITKRILDIYVNIIDKNKLKSLELTNNFKNTLNEEQTTLKNLKDGNDKTLVELNDIKLKNKNLEEKLTEYTRLVTKSKETLNEYKDLNTMLKDKNEELMKYKSESEDLKLLNEKIKEDLTESIKASQNYSNQLQSERIDNSSVRKQLEEIAIYYEKKLKEQFDDFNKKLSLREHEFKLFEQKKLIEKDEEYRERIWALKSQFEDRVTTLISEKETLLSKFSTIYTQKE